MDYAYNYSNRSSVHFSVLLRKATGNKLYLVNYMIIAFQYHQVKENTDSKLFWEAMHNIDYKFILIPVMFIFLRVWSLIISILLDYCRVKVPATALKALVYMAVSLLLCIIARVDKSTLIYS